MADEYEIVDEYEGDHEHEDEADADGSCGDKRGYYVLEVPKSMTPPPFRLVKLKAGQDLDPREIVAVPFLHYARLRRPVPVARLPRSRHLPTAAAQMPAQALCLSLRLGPQATERAAAGYV
jgi:hypothetical protein